MVTEIEPFESSAHFSPPAVLFLFVRLSKERSLRTGSGYTRRTARLKSGCCWLHKETWRSEQTNSLRYSHTSCNRQWGCRWDIRLFIMKCNNSHFYVTNLSLELTVSNLPSLLPFAMLSVFCTFRHLCLGNHSKLDTRSYELAFPQLPIL